MIEQKKLEMSFLYTQSIEIIKLYHQEIKKNINILKYYIIPKKWLDNYKLKNNYSSIKEDIPLSDEIDYNILKVNNKINYDLNENLIESLKETEFIENYKICYPKNFILVKQEIFNKLNKIYLYEVIFGEKRIIIFDNNKKSKNKNIFICSLKFENDYTKDITDFVINVDSIIIIDENKIDNEIKKFLNFISENKGIKNYYKERNINVDIIGQQIIYNKEEDKIGIFYQLLNKVDFDKNKIEENYLLEYLNNNNRSDKKGFTKIGIKAICKFKEQKSKEENKKKNKSKCITIYGDIYYYLKNNEINNSSISEYKNN